MRIGIIGGGVVGHATARCFMEHAEVMVFDIVAERRTHGVTDVLNSDLVFVCLPTPQKRDSLECDLSAVTQFFAWIQAADHIGNNFVLRSTVPIGTTRLLREKYALPNLVHSPEFLTARCAVTDSMLPARNIIGVPEPRNSDSLIFSGSNSAAQELNILYHTRFPGVKTHLMVSDESEAVKLMLNSFFAVKVSYFNECYALAQKLGLDWEVVRAGILSDGRVAHAHTQVPGPDGKLGFGGTCLPKDLANLVTSFWQNKVEGGAKVMLAAMERNHFDRGTPDGREPQEGCGTR